jgi:hypothetical protein
MKNKMYIVGLVSVMLIGLGGICKINHFPGAGILLTIGIVALSFWFFPIAFISTYRQNESKNGLIYLMAALMGIILFTSALFKIMHWPGASIMLIVATLFPVGVFLPVFIVHFARQKEESIKNFMYIMFLLVFISGMASLLAVNVSYRIVRDQTALANLTDLTTYYEIKNEGLTVSNPEIDKKSKELINFIDELKTELLLKSSADNQMAIIDKNHFIYWNIFTRDNLGVVNRVMISEESASKLKEQLHELSASLIQNQQQPKLYGYIDQLLAANPIKYGENEISWEKANFENQLMIFTFGRLTEIQNNIRLAVSLTK